MLCYSVCVHNFIFIVKIWAIISPSKECD